uniref:Interferon-induced protein with tetratricopeptide repeats 5-like n=1 Tax=Neolamprologus brichardi TaxID=32507 RepID=A0A3Q4I5H7_NEOBR
ISMCNDLHRRLQQLQSRFTWDLKKEDLELDDLSKQLQHDIDLQLGQRGALAHSYRFLSYVRYLQGKPEEALSLLTESEEKTRECYGRESELRLIVTYGDLAWLKYHTEDYEQSQTYFDKCSDTHPPDSSTDLHPEVYGEKGWTFLKFSHSYYTKAEECFCKALELQPDDWEWNTGYAIVLYRTEQVQSISQSESPATKQLRRALEKNPDDGVLMSLLALKLVHDMNKHTEAKGLVKKALEVGQDDTQVTRYVAKYLRNQDQLDESIDLLKSMLEKKSQSSFIHHQLALCYEKKKNKLLGERDRPESGTVQHWRSLCIQHLEESVRLKKGFNAAKALLALQYAQNFERRSALELCINTSHWKHCVKVGQLLTLLYAKRMQTQPDLSKQEVTFSILLQKLTTIAEKGLKRNHRDAASYGILGAVARAKGDRSAAVRNYERALEIDANNDEYLLALWELRLDLTAHGEEKDRPEEKLSEAACEKVCTRKATV